MTPLQKILVAYRTIPKIEPEKGTYFEELNTTYLCLEPAEPKATRCLGGGSSAIPEGCK